MRLIDAKKLQPGTTVCHKKWKNSDGTPMRFKVNGKPKTWKRDKKKVYVPLKRGLYEYGYMSERDAKDFKKCGW